MPRLFDPCQVIHRAVECRRVLLPSFRSLPADSVQHNGRITLKLPIRHFAVGILHIDEKIEVGIRSLNACDDTGQRDGFVTVVLRAERMMRQQRRSGQQTTRKYDESHMPPYQVPPPFR